MGCAHGIGGFWQTLNQRRATGVTNEPGTDGRRSDPGPSVLPVSLTLLIIKASGSTDGERYLNRIAERSFLSLWTYFALFRDQGGGGAAGGAGKELADLVVVCGRDVVMLPDKDCVSDRLKVPTQ